MADDEARPLATIAMCDLCGAEYGDTSGAGCPRCEERRLMELVTEYWLPQGPGAAVPEDRCLRTGTRETEGRRKPMHECEAPGCGHTTGREQFLCPAHWRRVPRLLQTAVYVMWRRRCQAVGTPEYPSWRDAHEQAKSDALAAIGGTP
jgi:DNA-directed RNA polymerase subunit RPC12/RpoP